MSDACKLRRTICKSAKELLSDGAGAEAWVRMGGGVLGEICGLTEQ
jgi:hypothetical protein